MGMKRIVLPPRCDEQIIQLDRDYEIRGCEQGPYTFYKVGRSNPTIAVLSYDHTYQHYGFKYFNALTMNRSDKLVFCAPHAYIAVEKALEAGRDVFQAGSFMDLVHFCTTDVFKESNNG